MQSQKAYTIEQDGRWAVGSYKHTDEYIEVEYNEEGVISAPEGLVDQIAADSLATEHQQFRIKRNDYLKQCDIKIYKAEDSGSDTADLRELRQALRDATDNWVMPDVSLLD